MNSWIDFASKSIPMFLAGVGTWLGVRSFYEKKHQEVLDRYATGREKAYAAERDFAHLSRNQEQMKEALKQLDDELTETRADFKELKGMLYTMFNRTDETLSGIFAKRERKE